MEDEVINTFTLIYNFCNPFEGDDANLHLPSQCSEKGAGKLCAWRVDSTGTAHGPVVDGSCGHPAPHGGFV
jgi:hypothetical protein